MQCGYQKRTREIVDWARSKRRRYIRREELLAYLAGKPPPPSVIHVTRYPHTKQQQQHGQLHQSQIHQNQQQSPQSVHNEHLLHNGTFVTPNVDSDLHTFKEALARRPR